MPDRFTSVRAYELLKQAFPKDVEASRVVFALEREDGPLTDADFEVALELVKDLEQLPRLEELSVALRPPTPAEEPE